MSNHRCPAPKCESVIDDSRLACGPHWGKLPWPIRRKVRDGWALRKRTGEESEHLAAVAEAIQYWTQP